MIFYQPALLIWLKKMFKHSEEHQWFETYHAFDIHGVISKPDYRKTEKIGEEFSINYYPYAKETLQLLSQRNDMILFIFSSSYPNEIKEYIEIFEKDKIHFKYINENPEISEANGCFGYYEKKPYFNSIWEDKSGFNPDKDWYPIYKYFKKTKYRPDPKWAFKKVEQYHQK